MRDFAEALAREAGGMAKAAFRSGLERRVKADGSFITDADEGINRLVIDRVHERFPDHDVYGEEASDRHGSEYVWVCDPIDGTNPFSHNVPTFVFSLALTHRGTPILGVIYDPMLDRLYAADLDSGTTLNGEPVAVSSASEVRGTLVGAALWHGARYDLAPVIPRLIEARAHVQDCGSIAYMAMLVASGEYSAVIFPGSTGHDMAAAKILVERAGGKATSFAGTDQSYDGEIDGAILSNGRVHDEILRLIADL